MGFTITDSRQLTAIPQFATSRKVSSDELWETLEGNCLAFQFPTSGKGHSDFSGKIWDAARQEDIVSIPYEREGAFRRDSGILPGVDEEFVSIPYEREGAFRHLLGFLLVAAGVAVSIPYEREGAFRRIAATTADRDRAVSIPYEREGAFRRKLTALNPAFLCGKVSIPYEREGAFRLQEGYTVAPTSSCFNSLRAGRGIQTIVLCIERKTINVSIPYEREGAFRHEPTPGWGGARQRVSIPYEREGAFRPGRSLQRLTMYLCFNSLRAGRGIQTGHQFKDLTWRRVFQFPTSGKGHSDSVESAEPKEDGLVSIPYEREGAFRLLVKGMLPASTKVSIPYEREGAFRQKSQRDCVIAI